MPSPAFSYSCLVSGARFAPTVFCSDSGLRDESAVSPQPPLSPCAHPAALSVPLVLIVLSVSGQVGSNAGIVGMTKEHLGLALALNVPVFVVVTKIDMCPANILQGKCGQQQSGAVTHGGSLMICRQGCSLGSCASLHCV